MIYATSLKRVSVSKMERFFNEPFQLFGIESYLKSLEKVARDKEIDVRTRRNLIEVNSDKKIATFELLDENAKSTGKTEDIEVTEKLNAKLRITPVFPASYWSSMLYTRSTADVRFC